MAAVQLTLDWRVLAFSAAITIASAVAFGLAPALAASRRALQEGLRDGGRGTAGGRSHRLQHSLIVIETALAVVLLTTGGLLLQTFHHLRQLNPGIRAGQLLTFVTPLFRYRDFVYRVHEQADQSVDQPSGIVVRTNVAPVSIVPAVRQAIWAVDRNQPITRLQTVEDIVSRQLAVPSQNMALSSAFALLALLLASIGLYGVLSYSVTQRTNEIGVRLALGATSVDILMSSGRRGLALTLAGLTLGVMLAAVLSRLVTPLFYGFTPGYIPTVAAVSLILLAVATLACLVPALRASRVNPMVALRHD